MTSTARPSVNLSAYALPDSGTATAVQVRQKVAELKSLKKSTEAQVGRLSSAQASQLIVDLERIKSLIQDWQSLPSPTGGLRTPDTRGVSLRGGPAALTTRSPGSPLKAASEGLEGFSPPSKGASPFEIHESASPQTPSPVTSTKLARSSAVAQERLSQYGSLGEWIGDVVELARSKHRCPAHASSDDVASLEHRSAQWPTFRSIDAFGMRDSDVTIGTELEFAKMATIVSGVDKCTLAEVSDTNRYIGRLALEQDRNMLELVLPAGRRQLSPTLQQQLARGSRLGDKLDTINATLGEQGLRMDVTSDERRSEMLEPFSRTKKELQRQLREGRKQGKSDESARLKGDIDAYERGEIFYGDEATIRGISYVSGSGNTTCQTNVGIPFSYIGSSTPLLENDQGTPVGSGEALRAARDLASKFGASDNVRCALTVIFMQMNHAMGESNKNSAGIYIKCSPEDIAASILSTAENRELLTCLGNFCSNPGRFHLPEHKYAERHATERIQSVMSNVAQINDLRAALAGRPIRLPSVASDPTYGVRVGGQRIEDLHLPHTMNCPESRAPIFYTTPDHGSTYMPRIVVELRDSSSPCNTLKQKDR